LQKPTAFFLWFLILAAVVSAVDQEPANLSSPFVGRWEISLYPPQADIPIPLLVVEFSAGPSDLSGEIVAVLGTGMIEKATIDEVSSKDGDLSFALNAGLGTIRFRGKVSGDHLEGTAVLGEQQQTKWTGRPTSKGKIEISPLLDQSPRVPEARLQSALEIQNREERVAALRNFLEEFPGSPLREQALLEIALAPQLPSERASSIRRFLQDNPNAKNRDRAEFQLLATIPDPAERQLAEARFLHDFPESTFSGAVARAVFERGIRARPADTGKIAETIEQMIRSAPDREIKLDAYEVNQRLEIYNTIADRLMTAEVMLDKALELSEKAVAGATERTPPDIRGTYLTTKGQVLYKRKAYEQAEAVLLQAVDLYGNDSSGEASFFLGRIYEARGQFDAALQAYMRAAALSMTSETRSALESAYRKKNGTLDGIDETLDAVYRMRPKLFDPGRYSRAGSDPEARVVLAELFTGAECGPCAAADLAFDGIGERYDRNTVAVLSYHLHVPGPDPMTNPDTQNRAAYYQARGTPITIIDGTDGQSGGGGASLSPKLFEIYKAKIESRIGQKPAARFSNLTLRRDGEEITVSGRVSLPSEGGGSNGSAKLRLALVQDGVRYTGSNGVRFHDFVVRKFLGSVDGIAVQPGSNEFRQTALVGDIADELQQYVAAYEKERSERLQSDFRFAGYTSKMKPEQVAVVAFVQDDRTKEILQAAVLK
jgi:tetratricopeptide (TPR) repeat protein